MSSKKKGGKKPAAVVKVKQVQYQEIDPNNQLKADCGSEQFDEIINIPHTFTTGGSNARRGHIVSSTG